MQVCSLIYITPNNQFSSVISSFYNRSEIGPPCTTGSLQTRRAEGARGRKNGDLRWRPSVFRSATLTRSRSSENPFGPRGAIRGQKRDKGARVAPLYVVTAPQLFVSIRHAGFISAVSACTKTLFSIAQEARGGGGEGRHSNMAFTLTEGVRGTCARSARIAIVATRCK